MNQNLKRNARKNSVVTYHKKYVTHLLKLKNDFHSFIAAIHPLTLLSLLILFNQDQTGDEHIFRK